MASCNQTCSNCASRGACGSNSGCGACCGRSLELTPGELELLNRFAQLPFLPVARPADSLDPLCLEDGPEAAPALSRSIQGLRQKQLIRLDYNLPLSGFDYKDYPKHCDTGSMALTARGQQVLEQLDIQGIEE